MSWIDRQVRYWYGRSFGPALLGNWGEIKALLEATPFRKQGNQYLTINDTTETAVAAKYLPALAYRYKDCAQVLRDWILHDPDRRLDANHAFPIVMVDCIGPFTPLIAYNRWVVNGADYAILWPLDYHFEISLKGLQDTQPFPEKESKIVFRGALSGPLKSHKASQTVVKIARIEYVKRASRLTDIADVGFNFIPKEKHDEEGFAEIADQIEGLTRDTIPQERLLENRYVLCLEGADVSSGFGAALASNAVPLHPYPFCYHVWYFNGLEPWEHFVPLASDASDLEQVFAFCESHPELMETISRNGREHMQCMLDAGAIHEIKRRVVGMWDLRLI